MKTFTLSNSTYGTTSIVLGILTVPVIFLVWQTNVLYASLLPIVGLAIGALSVKTTRGAVGIFVNFFALILVGILALTIYQGGLR